jgi:hypothetical protein
VNPADAERLFVLNDAMVSMREAQVALDGRKTAVSEHADPLDRVDMEIMGDTAAGELSEIIDQMAHLRGHMLTDAGLDDLAPHEEPE